MQYFEERRETLADHPNPLGYFLWKCGKMMRDVNRRERIRTNRLLPVDEKVEAVHGFFEYPGSDDDLAVMLKQLEEELPRGEYEVLELDMIGAPDVEVAEELGISTTTVRTRRSKMRQYMKGRLRTRMRSVADPLDLY
ncbi:MAG: hypothetical protein JNL43_15125 [Flavobacteriales bacterium]|nr:hypothetical protein [Flavobacteriales bacterium]